MGLALNLAIAVAYVGYSHYDPNRAGDLRIASIGTPVAAWILSNTINTNQLGAGSDRVACLTSAQRQRSDLARHS